MNIITKNSPRFSFFFQKRCSCQRNLNRIFICVKKISQEWTLRFISSMCFINNKYSLQIRCIRRKVNFWPIFSKTLYIYNCNFRFSRISLLCLIVTKLLHKFSTRTCCFYSQSTSFKFFWSLFQQIKTVNNEIKLCNFILLAEIVRKNISKIIRKSCLSTTLSMPYNTWINTFINLTSYC